MRVGIVGGGPRALFAVERLWVHRLLDAPPLQVSVFDPHHPGFGAAYSVDQPHFLRLNVTSAVVCAGWPGDRRVPSLDQWRAARGEAAPLDPFPPRATVGAYLQWFWSRLEEQTPRGALLDHRPRRVERLARGESGWLIDGEAFDEVLLATGHEGHWPGTLRGERVVPAVFPVARWLDAGHVPDGSRVVARGAALTFIDAALTLTEGRGGTFSGEWRTGLVYQPSGREPAVIRPLARSGRWMDPKPQPGTPQATVPTVVLERGRSAVRAARTPSQMTAAVRDTALAMGGAPADVDELLTGGAPSADATQLLRRRLAAVAGEAPPDGAWALGHTWRGLYDELRHRVEGVQPSDDFAAFAVLAGRLERVAFGPPPINAAKLLALIDAGVIDPTGLGAGGTLAEARMLGDADVIVDAVLPPPGVVAGSLTARLVDAGVLTRAPGRRGVAVDTDATCLGAGGRLESLACVGRATEDVVIGNDTLNRRLHPAIDGWARRISAKGTP